VGSPETAIHLPASRKVGPKQAAKAVPNQAAIIKLISATVELMKREGVQSVTTRAIAKEANAPLAAANYRFSNKDELMDAAAEAWLKNLSRFSSDVSVHLGLRKAVEQVAEGYWRALEEEPASLLAEIELILWATRNAGV
jgi:AcrR family transcriptional regulator